MIEMKRFRTSFEHSQLDTLEKVFIKTHYPDAYVREDIFYKYSIFYLFYVFGM